MGFFSLLLNSRRITRAAIIIKPSTVQVVSMTLPLQAHVPLEKASGSQNSDRIVRWNPPDMEAIKHGQET